METINYSAMSDEELKSYFLQHREDKLALENYLNRVGDRPHQFITTVDDPDFEAKIHAVTTQKILNNNNGKSSIDKIYQQFQKKASDLLNTPWNLGITNLNRLIRFIDKTPIIYNFIQQKVLSYPIEIKDDLEELELKNLFNSSINEAIDGKEISFFYGSLKSVVETHETNEGVGCVDLYYYNLAYALVDFKPIGSSERQAYVDNFNKHLLQPYFVSHINSYLESIIMENQKKQVNTARIIHAKEYYEQSGQLGIGQMSGGEIKDQATVAGVINEAEQRNLAEVAKEIQQLLDQLSETYPTTTTSEKYEVAAKAIKTIEDDSLLMSKIIRVVKAALFEALKQAVNHPLVNIVMAGLEEALDKN
jgi:hypothetical protein